eukprot:m.329821 g.329821  ORF g.329821 m.329821 type:complete len:64 (-) comp16041_c0_seq2:700-891(-)
MQRTRSWCQCNSLTPQHHHVITTSSPRHHNSQLFDLEPTSCRILLQEAVQGELLIKQRSCPQP